MKLNSVLLAGLVSLGLLTFGANSSFAGGRGGRYFSAGNPGGIATTSGSRLAHTPANQAWARNNAWAQYSARIRQVHPNVTTGTSGAALQHNAVTPEPSGQCPGDL